MANPTNITQASETGDITTTTAFVRSFALTASNAVAVAELRAGGSNGDIKASLRTRSNTSVEANLHHAQFVGGVHVTISGTGAAASITWM